MATRKQLHVRVDQRDVTVLKDLADLEGVSVAVIVRRLVRAFVVRQPVPGNAAALPPLARSPVPHRNQV